MTIPAPTRELIESRKIAEGASYDFKQELDLEKKYPNGGKSAKERFIDDVVSFLNSETGGHIIIGVVESDGVWERFLPQTGDREKVCNRYLQVIQSLVSPIPTKVDVVTIDVPDGFVIDVQIPPHWKKPYQNSMSGAFYVRSGSRNRILSVPEIAEHFAVVEKMEADLTRLFREHENALSSEENLASASSLMFEADVAHISPRLIFGVLPKQFYDLSRARYNPGKMVHTGVASFHGGWYPKLRGGPGGFEAKSSHDHLFLATDWHILGWVSDPFDDYGGRPDLSQLKIKLNRYFASLDNFLGKEGVDGPFAVMLAISNLDQLEGWSGLDLPPEVGDSRPTIVERLNDEVMIDNLAEQVRSAIFG